MKLPNLESAIVPEKKLTAYLLNEEHPNGRGKAVFFLRYGFSVAEWEQLARALRNHASVHDVTKTEVTEFGTRYVVEGELNTQVDRRPRIRVVWFIENGRSQPHLVTAYPLETKND